MSNPEGLFATFPLDVVADGGEVATVSNVTDTDGALTLLQEKVSALEIALSAAEWAHAVEIAKISDALNNEAKARRWCSEYQQFIENINEELTYKLSLPKQTWFVEVEQEVMLMVRRVVEVEASTEEEADDLAIGQVIDANNNEDTREFFWTNSELTDAYENFKSDKRWGNFRYSDHKLGEVTTRDRS